MRDFDKAVQLDPKYAYAYNNRAATKFKLKDYAGSVEDCTEAIKINPNYGYAYSNRGNAKELLRDDSGACEDWKKAVELGVEIAKNHIGDCK